MTDNRKQKTNKLSREILFLLGVSFLISIFLFCLLFMCASVMIDHFLYMHDNAVFTDEQLVRLDVMVLAGSLLLAASFFVILFLFLLGDRLSYIRELIAGIDALQRGKLGHQIPLEGNNELTALARSVNYLSDSQRSLREQERLLNEEKDRLIHTLSHDIRTPLTSILSYSELMQAQENISALQQKEYLNLIQRKANQIKSLTDILLDGSRRNPEYFENAHLLMEQLAMEFEEALEDDFVLSVDLSDCPSFSGSFDVSELRRIIDNLISNVQKYAEPGKPVDFSIHADTEKLILRQKNTKRKETDHTESYQIGLNSIRRITHYYNGNVKIQTENDHFEIRITLYMN